MSNIVEINKLNISFGDNHVVENASFTAKSGTITALTGDSGSGKTTVLYALGLISSIDDYEYFFSGKKIEIKDDKLKSNLRKQKIGFIFQDNNLIEDLTIAQNIKLSTKLADREIFDEDIIQLFKETNLDLDINLFVRNLSGGERQRVAIISALAKNPDIIIADEPTSALDEDNMEIIFQIFSRFLKGKNKAVIIATHDESLCSKCHVVYKIEDKKLSLLKDDFGEKVDEELCDIKTNSLPLSFYFNYIKQIKTKTKIIKNISMVFCAIAITIAIVLLNSGINSSNVLKNSFNSSASTEVFLVNYTKPKNEDSNSAGSYYDSACRSIDSAYIEKIENLNGVANVYPFTQFNSYGYLPRKDEKQYVFSLDNDNFIHSQSKVIVKKNEKQISTNTLDANPRNENDLSEEYAVVSYAEEQNFKNISKVYDEKVENGIYITDSFAKKLGINSLGDIVLEFDMYIPTLQYLDISEFEHGGYDSAGKEYSSGPIEYQAKRTVDIKTTKQYRVKGIIFDFALPKYLEANNLDYYIFIPYNEAQLLIKEHADELYNPIIRYEKSFETEKWSPNSLNIFASDFSKTSEISEEVESLSDDLVSSMTYENIESMKNILENENQTMLLIIIGALVILILLISLILINDVIKRRYEISILRAEGLSQREIIKLFCIDAVFFFLKIFTITIALCFVVRYINLFDAFIINGYTFIFAIALPIISVFIPTIISIYSLNKLSPDEILRS